MWPGARCVADTCRVEPLVDDRDPRLDDYRHLTDASARRAIEGADGEGILVAEGVLALRQLLRSEHRVRSVLVTAARREAVEREMQLGGGLPGGAPLLVGSREVLRSVTGYDVHRGVLAAADRGRPRDPADVMAGARRVLVAEAVNDTENLGALFRNAAALGLDAVLLDDTAADPLYRRAIRVSSGWSLRLPWARLGPSETLSGTLRDHGFTSVALTPGDDALPVDVAADRGLLDDPVAFVVGSEGAGLSEEVLGRCDATVRVPMWGEVDSLNVATSLAVVAAFAAARRGWA